VKQSETGGRKGRLVLTVIHNSAVPRWFPDRERAAPTVQLAEWDRHSARGRLATRCLWKIRDGRSRWLDGHGDGVGFASAGSTRLSDTAPQIARRQTEHGSDLGAPCVVERTFGWLHHLQRLLGRATTGAPRSMKPSSHSAADEAGSRTDRW
jgi:hypothetical protein